MKSMRSSRRYFSVMPMAGYDVTGHLYGEDRVEIADGTVVWWCPGAGHAVAPVGQLTAEVARML